MRIRTEKVAIPRLRKELDGYRILHVSDIHFDEKTGRDSELWSELYASWADVALITGDFITDDVFIDPLVEKLAGIKAKDGVFGILGNHDYYYLTLAEHIRHAFLGRDLVANDWKRLRESLSRIGIRVLINESLGIRTHLGALIFLEGTDDPEFGTPVIADVNEAYTGSDAKILMSHSPDMLYSTELRKKKFDLLLSGHTHGGQIRIPGIGALVTGTHYAKRSEAFGLFRTSSGMAVNVSAGIGYSNLRVRINCPPELVRIELVRS